PGGGEGGARRSGPPGGKPPPAADRRQVAGERAQKDGREHEPPAAHDAAPEPAEIDLPLLVRLVCGPDGPGLGRAHGGRLYQQVNADPRSNRGPFGHPFVVVFDNVRPPPYRETPYTTD